jgi:hypothetical protein
MPDESRLAIGNIPYVGREFLGRGQDGAINQHGDDHDLLFKSPRQFHADEISRIVEAAFSGPVGGIEPASANDGEKNLAVGQAVIERGAEIGPALDRIHINE